MESDFAYEQLSPDMFESLAVSLTESVAGAGVEAYGPGPDGGREATYTGVINWSATTGESDGVWDGYTVVQAKQRQTLTDSPTNLRWLQSQLSNEVNRWLDPEGKRRQSFPQYLLVITNVRLSAADPGGGIDALRDWLNTLLDTEYKSDDDDTAPRSLRRCGLRALKVWHRDTLNMLLAGRDGVRKRFAALITLGDVLARIERLDTLLPGLIPHDHLASVLRDHARETLKGERWARFDEAGDDSNRRSIERVIFDLPVSTWRQRQVSALQLILNRGDRVLSPSVPRPAGDYFDEPLPRHLVITGAPGNGKSTLVKYLTQVYRASFTRAEANEDAVQTIIGATDQSIERLSLTAPHSPRWPLRVDLAVMAEAMGTDGGPSLRRFLCDQINLYAKVVVHGANLDDWLKMWPSVLFFDGLDEVTHPALRQRVIHEITDLVEKAKAIDADIFVVITTRPTGYTPLLPDHFEQIDLDHFTEQEARDYGHHVTSERLADDPEHRRSTLERFDSAIHNPVVERLLTTPLQVLILTVIVARGGQLPTNRYELFWSYYDTVFKREAAKPTWHRDFLNRHRTEITDLHQRVGFILHRLCEATRELRGRMHLDELRGIARDHMMTLGHQRDVADDMADRLINIATHRLVLLSADEDNTVSFDIRSLQELMAGCALVDLAETDARDNLTAAACSPHWRNAWLFGAGRLYTGTPHQRRLVLDVVKECDAQGHWHGWLYPAGPGLAADMLADGLAADRPADRRCLLNIVMRALDGPMPENIKHLARQVSAATDTADKPGLAATGITSDRLHVRDILRRAFSDCDARHAGYAIAAAFVHFGELGTHIPGQPGDTRAHVDAWTYREPVGERIPLGDFFVRVLKTYDPGAYPPQQLVAEALHECNQLQMIRSLRGNLRLISEPRTAPTGRLHAALSDPDAETELQIITQAVPPEDWPAVSLLARGYWPTASRWPIADRLKGTD